MHTGDSKKSAYIIAGAILVAGVLSFVALVIADSESLGTTVEVLAGNSSPSIDNIKLNGGNNITLNENTFVIATTTIDVSDADGCDTINHVEAKLYRTATNTDGTTCTDDDNNCYSEFIACAATTTGDTCDASPDTAGEYDCSFRLWYIADPTDAGSANAGDIWALAATTSDGSATTTATNTGETIEVNTLTAHNVTASIAYGAVAAGDNTGTSDQTVTITNTGNEALDTNIEGDSMCDNYPTCDGENFPPGQQKFDLTASVDYPSKTFTLQPTGSPATIETILAKPTATTSAVTDDTYWGIAVPSGTPNNTYTGQNTFTAVSD